MKRDFSEILLILLTVLVFLAVFVVLLALVYPNAAKSIIADISESSSGGGGALKTVGKVAKRAEEGFNARVAPGVRWVLNRMGRLFLRQDKRKVASGSGKPGPTFKAQECIACHEHENLFDQKAFGNIYMDHRIHDAAEVACGDCHLNSKHPNPRLIKQSSCISCHKKKRISTDCLTCHPPGSIFDKAVITEKKTADFLSGSTVHQKSLMPKNFGQPDPAWLKGQGQAPCRNCHTVPSFCNGCHLAFHSNMPDWRQVHGPRLLRQEYVMNVCWTCHSSNWCAGNCHMNEGAVRKPPYLDLPQVPLESYLR